MKKIVSYILVLIIILIPMNTTDVVAAAEKDAISYKLLTTTSISPGTESDVFFAKYKNKKFSKYIESKASLKSSNESIVKIVDSENNRAMGRIKALKVGSATISMKYKSRTYRYKVYVCNYEENMIITNSEDPVMLTGTINKSIYDSFFDGSKQTAYILVLDQPVKVYDFTYSTICTIERVQIVISKAKYKKYEDKHVAICGLLWEPMTAQYLLDFALDSFVSFGSIE